MTQDVNERMEFFSGAPAPGKIPFAHDKKIKGDSKGLRPLAGFGTESQ